MSAFFAARGCVYAVKTEQSGGKGWFTVDGLARGPETSPTLIQGIELSAASLVQPVVALDNSKYLYTFGVDFSSITVFGEILLGPAGAGSPEGLKKVENFFKTRQVAVSKTPVIVSAPGVKGWAVYLTGLQIGRVDPELHVQPFALQGAIAASVGD